MRGEDGDKVTAEQPTEEACSHCGQLTARVHQRSKKASPLLWGFVGQRRLEQAEAKATLPRWPLLKAEERLTSKQNARLEGMRVCFPTIAEHHWLKERVRGLYRCATRQAAVDHWHNLLVNMEALDAAAVFLWAKTLRSWGKETLGYFALRIMNGYTEGCHTKIKLLKRLSYGFRNVQVYIHKMLLGFLPRAHHILAPHLLT